MATYGPKPKPRNLDPDTPAPWDCMRCGRSLLVRDYHPHSGAAYGYSKKCRDCANRENREAAARRGADYDRNKKLQANFGLTLQQVGEMLEAQGGCAICGTSESGKRFWSVDHDHACCPTSGKSCGKCVRGILCHNCNLGLGHLKDSVATLTSAIQYLEAASGVE